MAIGERKERNMKVEQIMTVDPMCCTRDDFVHVAASIMKRFDTGIVAVTEKLAQPSRLIGVLTDRDLCLGVLAMDRDPKLLRIEEFVSTKPVTCLPADTVEKALEKMAHAKVRRLPVVNRNFELVGMLSLGDIIRHKAAHETDIYKTLAAISASARPTAKPKKAAA
jgi:CBS domain-containing protein